GFGFVELPGKMPATPAMRELNGVEIQGRSLIVNEARPQRDKRSGGGSGGGDRRHGGGGGGGSRGGFGGGSGGGRKSGGGGGGRW
ncbi:MAG: RNA-binding protein, partial [candidate division KSB1 bacterium]